MSDKKFSFVKMVNSLHSATMSIMLAVMVIAIFYQVISRYFLNLSLVWAEELARGCFIWMVFLGLSYVERNDEPIKITILRNVMPSPVKLTMSGLSELLSFVFCVTCAYFGFERVAFLTKSGQIAPGLQIGMVWFYLAIPVGFTLTSLEYVLRLIIRIRNLRTKKNPEIKEVEQ